MATGVASWSTTAATNSSADSAVNWAEGQAPSSVNDSARAMMASVAKWRDDMSGAITTAGTSTAYTATTNQTFASLSALDDRILTIVPHTTSGASPTLAVDSLTAKAINISTGVAVPTGYLVSGTPYVVYYEAGVGEYIVLGSPGAISTGAIAGTTGTFSGAVSGTTGTFSGAVSGTTGTFSGAVAGTTGTFSGAVAGTTGTFSGAVSGTTGTFSGALSGASLTGTAVATQSDQETATSTTTAVSPGRQHFHPSAAKFWLKAAGAGTLTSSYNITSVTDTGTGVLTVTIATDFSSADYCVSVGWVSASVYVVVASQAAGTFALNSFNFAGSATDPTTYFAVGFGDHA